ncbi:MAG: 2-C-methyl-D-erythritol 4-phosphate cytidylyltransferase [Deltaproteobacteria bacterium]|nr:2-C-methyl-D-erythritol 4-phosphate cytidylyltransferase [Deltaproteobacteria bacterium]
MNIAIIVAGGIGSRLGLGYNKVFAELKGRKVLAYTIANFERCAEVDQIVVCAGNHESGTAHDDIKSVSDLIIEEKFHKVSRVVAGGSTRMESVQCGIDAVSPKLTDILLVQDGSRPFISNGLIVEMIEKAKSGDAVICGAVPKDTIQILDERGFSVETPERNKLLAIYTPFVGTYRIIREARDKAIAENYLNTPGYEDSALIQKLGKAVQVVESPYSNIKITTQDDLKLAEWIIEQGKY